VRGFCVTAALAGGPSLISNSASAHSLPLALIALISRRRSRTCAKTAPTSSAPSAKPAGAKADVNVDAMPDTIAVPKVSPWRRCSRCDGKRVSTRPHGPRPTSGVPDYRPECPYARRPTGAGIRSARAKVQQRMVLAGSHLRLGRNQQAIGAKEQDESHDACA
jgi:hypothetical protein